MDSRAVALEKMQATMQHVVDEFEDVEFRLRVGVGSTHYQDYPMHSVHAAAVVAMSGGQGVLQIRAKDRTWRDWWDAAVSMTEEANRRYKIKQEEEQKSMVAFEETSEDVETMKSEGVDAGFRDAVDKLREDLRQKANLPSGSIVRWTSVSYTGQRYDYVAIYANRRFYTSLVNDNSHLQRVMEYDDLLEYLRQDDRIVDVMIATQFERLI